jgi:acyl-CoA synthetase (AMP-forming)/AMP-acid ligase II
VIETVLQAVLANPDIGPIHLVGANGESAEVLSRDELLQRGAEVASAFRGLGVEPGDRVAAFLPNGRTFLETMFGAWMCRAALVPLASAGSKRRGELLLRRIASVMEVAAPRVVVGTDDALALVAAAGGSAGAHMIRESAIDTFRGGTR